MEDRAKGWVEDRAKGGGSGGSVEVRFVCDVTGLASRC